MTIDETDYEPRPAEMPPLPISLLRLVVQVEDTPANRATLSEAHNQLLQYWTFEGVQNAVKLEQLKVISLCKPN